MDKLPETISLMIQRIDQLTLDAKPRFGKMNAGQMICHCTDFYRMAMGEIKAEEYGSLTPEHVRTLAREGKTVPAPKGFDQVAGGGTQPTLFEKDKALLKIYLKAFNNLDEDFEFAPHPYFGKMDRKAWTNLSIYHLNHHLNQFGG